MWPKGYGPLLRCLPQLAAEDAAQGSTDATS